MKDLMSSARGSDMPKGMRRDSKIEFCHESWGSDIAMELHFNPDINLREIANHNFASLFEGEKHSNYEILVGLNASGKTTLFTLIEDFYSTFEDLNRTGKKCFH